MEADENQPAVFSVQVSGDAQTNVEWSHNGIPIRNGMNNIQVRLVCKVTRICILIYI